MKERCVIFLLRSGWTVGWEGMCHNCPTFCVNHGEALCHICPAVWVDILVLHSGSAVWWEEGCVIFVLQSGSTMGWDERCAVLVLHSGWTVEWEGQCVRHCTSVVIYIWHGGIIVPLCAAV